MKILKKRNNQQGQLRFPFYKPWLLC